MFPRFPLDWKNLSNWSKWGDHDYLYKVLQTQLLAWFCCKQPLRYFSCCLYNSIFFSSACSIKDMKLASIYVYHQIKVIGKFRIIKTNHNQIWHVLSFTDCLKRLVYTSTIQLELILVSFFKKSFKRIIQWKNSKDVRMFSTNFIRWLIFNLLFKQVCVTTWTHLKIYSVNKKKRT